MASAFQYHTSAIEPQLSAKDVAEFHAQGFFIVRGVLGPAELSQLSTACIELQQLGADFAEDAFIDKAFFNVYRNANPFAKDINSVPTEKGKIRRVTYPYAVNSTFNEFRRHPRLLGCVTPVFGNEIRQIVNQVNFHYAGSQSGWGWHQDYRFRKPGIPDIVRNFVQTIIAIDPCNENTGGLRVIPRSHLLGDLKLDVENERAETFFDVKTAITPNLNPGDVILFNSHLIHGSQANLSQNIRRVYINGFAVGTATTGMPVVRGGQIVHTNEGIMEYENDPKMLPKASKY